MFTFNLRNQIAEIEKFLKIDGNVQTPEDRETLEELLDICEYLSKGRQINADRLFEILDSRVSDRSRNLSANGISTRTIALVLKTESEIRTQVRVKIAEMPAILDEFGVTALSDRTNLRDLKDDLFSRLVEEVRYVLSEFVQDGNNVTTKTILIARKDLDRLVKALKRALKGWEVDQTPSRSTIDIYNYSWNILSGVSVKLVYELV